jgi:hypothetical protein
MGNNLIDRLKISGAFLSILGIRVLVESFIERG